MLRNKIEAITNENEENINLLFGSEKEILQLNKPRVWNINVSGNMEVEMEVDFDKFLIHISEHTTDKIDEMSTFRFFVLVDYLKEKHAQNGRSNN